MTGYLETKFFRDGCTGRSNWQGLYLLGTTIHRYGFHELSVRKTARENGKLPSCSVNTLKPDSATNMHYTNERRCFLLICIMSKF